MNFTLPHIPERPSKPRNSGLTMMMDKGLSIRQVEDFLSANADYTDIIKLGFGTSYLTKNLEQKIKLYKEAGMKIYLGGTLFEAFIVRGMFDDYMKLIDRLKLNCAEVSDGSIHMPHDQKCEYIHKLSKNYTVFSEVGSKEAGLIIHPAMWVSMMNKELQAGSWKVIAEARESGNVGIYRGSGEVREGLVQEILTRIPAEKIIWEAPQKAQQLYFLELVGCNANLGNLAPNEVISLEAMRVGLRGDTFNLFLDRE